jgi:hypothetical protein
MPPVATRWPTVRAANYADAPHGTYKNATREKPVPHKLWFMSKRQEPSYRRRALWMLDVDLSCVSRRKLCYTLRISRKRSLSSF